LIALSTKLAIVVTIDFVDDTYTTVEESWLFPTSRSTVTLLIPSLWFVVQLVFTVDEVLRFLFYIYIACSCLLIHVRRLFRFNVYDAVWNYKTANVEVMA